MIEQHELREQLVRLVESRCIDPLEILLQDADTSDASDTSDVVAAVRGRVHERADGWAHAMLTTDERAAGQAIIRVIAALYPSDQTFDPSAEWWRTPLGQVTALRLGHPTATRVPYSVAGAMLGISRQGVHDLLERGKLERHPEGGVTPASVRERLRSRTEVREP